LLKTLLEQAIAHEQKAEWDNAARYYLKGLEIDADNKDLLLNLAACYYNKGLYEQALDFYVRCYQHSLQTVSEKERIIQFILDTYYQPNVTTFQTNYEKNIQLFKEYSFNFLSDFPPFDELTCYCVPASDHKFYLFDKTAQDFRNIIDLTVGINIPALPPGKCVITVDIFAVNDLEQILNQTEDPAWINGIKAPVYAIWKDEYIKYAYMQVGDYQRVISGARMVFFDTYTKGGHFEKFFMNCQASYPEEIIAGPADMKNLDNVLTEVFNSRQDVISNKFSISQKYALYSREYYRDLFSKPLDNLRVLFITSRFTQVVQYTVRDFMKACGRLGIQCCLAIEESPLHRITKVVLMDKITEFQPNIVFTPNYFRMDYQILPKSIIQVTWVQDPMPQLGSKEHAQGFGPYDYILSYSQLYTNQMVNTGYPPDRINLQMICFDEQVFHPRHQDSEENQYESEVAVCANYNYIPEQIRNSLIDKFSPEIINPELHRRIVCLFNRLYQMMDEYIQKGGLILSCAQCLETLQSLRQQLGLTVDEQCLGAIAEDIFSTLAYGLHREHVIRSIYQAGFRLKLWGKHWDTSAEFAPYAVGWVEHGPELAKVYSHSKIVIGAFSHVTAHFRIWEAIGCGALVMVRNVPPEFDLCDIRNTLSDGDGFVFYDDLTDLTAKIRYYLDHEAERRQIVATGQIKVRERLTYTAAVQNWLNFVKNDLNRTIEG
jgi:spore maturation protein CgeB